METFIEQKTLKLKKVEFIKTIGFGVFFMLIFTAVFFKIQLEPEHNTIKNELFSVALCGIAIYMFWLVIWKILGETILSVENGVLYIQYQLLFIRITRAYEIRNISDLQINKNADSTFGWNLGGFVIPDKTSCIAFNYKLNKKQLDGDLSDDDFKLLKQWIKQ